MKMTLSKRQFTEAFETFTEKVNKDKYQKIPYLTWKNLQHLAKDISFDYIEITIEVLSIDNSPDIFFSPVVEGSLIFRLKQRDVGDFLTELYHIYYNTIVINDCNTTPTIKINDYNTPIVINNYNENIAIEERKNDMNNSIFGNFDFGAVNSDTIKLSPYGLAIKDASGSWVSYDKGNNKIVNVDILNFNFENMLYKMPVAIKDVAVGDIVIHARKPLYVTEVLEGKVIGIDPYAGEEKTILFAHSPFGFDFVTKVVNLMDGIFDAETATADSPFGSYLPLMLMGSNGGNIDMNAILPFMLMGNGNVDNKMLMFMAMSNGGQNNNLLPLMLMMSKEGK